MGLLTADTPRDTAIAWGFVAGQAVLLLLVLFLPPGDAWSVPSWLDAAAYWFQVLGMVVLVVGLVNLGRSVTALPTPVPHGVLRTGGLYRFVRHPVYSGVMALALGRAIVAGSIAIALAAVALVVWFSFKARWEEQQLERRYAGYAEYCRATPRFVPFWPVSRRPAGRRRTPASRRGR